MVSRLTAAAERLAWLDRRDGRQGAYAPRSPSSSGTPESDRWQAAVVAMHRRVAESASL
jgi:hypothetical protein